MKKSYFFMALSLFIFFGGCSEIDRVGDEVSGITQPKDDNQTSFILPSDGGVINVDINDTVSGVGVGDINDTNSTVGVITIDAKNAYKISARFSNKYNERGYYSRGEIGELYFDITNIYTKDPADTDIIENIILEMEDKDSDTNGTYLDFITYTGEQGPIFSIPNKDVKASDHVALKMRNLSGTTNIILSVKIKDFDERFILKIPVVIEKNKSSSMAIVSIGTRYENGLFIDKFVIHVVDSYGNKAIDGTSISTGVINNPKLYSNAYNGGMERGKLLDDQTLPKNIWGDITKIDYGLFPDNMPNIFYNLKSDIASLNRSDSSIVLPPNSIDTTKDTITSLDTLVVLANKDHHKPENLGGWDIRSIDSDSKISLVNLDIGDDIDGVSYVLGDEYRYDKCRQTIMNAAASTFESTDVKDGLAYAELRYVPDMVGKNIFIYANSRLDNKHIGISRKVVLTGLGLETQTMSCTNDKGLKPDCTMRYRMMQKGSGHIAREVYIAQPVVAGEAVYRASSASRTDCDGWTTVSIYGIEENATATVSFGDFISDELIVNQK